MIKIGLVGLGYWGANLARVLHESQRCVLEACSDVDSQKVERIAHRYPGIHKFQSATDLLDSEVDAVVIATPIASHYSLACQALTSGKHVLVEKPLANSSRDALALVALANEVGRTLMTGHTFLFSPAVVNVKELIDAGKLGDLRYISSSRLNLGLYRNDVDVVWDLAVHDVSILLYWLEDFPVQAFSFGRACLTPKKQDVAFLWFQFASGCIASCEVSWLSPQKMRRTCVVGSERMVVYDDTDPNEKVKIYNKGVTLHEPRNFGEFQLSYRVGEMVAPALDNAEPLAAEIDHFLCCIEAGKKPRSDGAFGAQVVRAVEMATNGTPVSPLTQVAAGSSVKFP